MKERTVNMSEGAAREQMIHVYENTDRYVCIFEKDGETEPCILSGQMGIRVEDEEPGWQLEVLRQAREVLRKAAGEDPPADVRPQCGSIGPLGWHCQAPKGHDGLCYASRAGMESLGVSRWERPADAV